MTNIKSIVSAYNKSAKKDVIQTGMKTGVVGRLPTGIFELDYTIGGGIPLGRVSIFYGAESSAKTSLCLLLIAQAQRLYPKGECVYIDVEGHFDPDWAAKLGVDTDKLIYVLPESGEAVVDITFKLLGGQDLVLLVVDSMAAMVTEKELEKDAVDAIVGNTGILINKLYRKIGNALGVARKDGFYPTIALVNQLRSKIGVKYGDPEDMPGGKSFKYASSMTIRLYGKNETVTDIHPTLPAYRKITATVHKYKVPIISSKCEFLMALMPIEKYGLKEGQVYSWNFVLSCLKSMGLLIKGDGGYELVTAETGETQEFAKQDLIKQRYFSDQDFKSMVHSNILTAHFKQK